MLSSSKATGPFSANILLIVIESNLMIVIVYKKFSAKGYTMLAPRLVGPRDELRAVV